MATIGVLEIGLESEISGIFVRSRFIECLDEGQENVTCRDMDLGILWE